MNHKTRLGWARAKDAGARAARAGLMPGDNPYRRSELGNHSWWDAGWWEAENQMAVEADRAVRTIDGGICLMGDNIERQKRF